MAVNDADVGRSVDEAQRILDALKFKDEFGEGCPINWKKGDKGIDVKTPNKVEGNIEFKKSWSEWARPKLQRAWSGTSGICVSSHTNVPFRSPEGSVRTRSYLNLGSRNQSQSHLSLGMKSSLVGFEHQMEETLLQQRMENLQYQNQHAAYQNQSVGMAN